MFKKIIYLFLTTAVLAGCESSEKENGAVITARDVIAEVSGEFAPDRRVALFDIEAGEKGEQVVLKGESNLPAAVENLRNKLKEREISYVDSIRLLPSEEIKGTSQAVIKISVANLRGKPGHSSELVTQATLGMPVKVFKKSDSWYLIQTPDDYLAWVDYGGVQLLSDEEFKDWKAADKIIYMEPFGFSFKKPDTDSQRVADLVAGGILELSGETNGFYEVKYPTGRKAYVEKEDARLYDDWLSEVEASQENLVATSKSLMGLPYLWGGTSAKGVDCSGFTKTVFFLNGMIIPRDASQQIHTGKEVDTEKNFENLIPGDLLFFGRPATDSTAERVIHVGMWIGDNKFIHSMGEVHISNMDTEAEDFDEYNYNRYLRSKRVAGEENNRLIYLTQRDIFSDTTGTNRENFKD